MALCLRNVGARKRRESERSQFDLHFGLETDGTVELGDLKIDSPSYIWGIAYAPTPATFFERVITLLPPPETYTFVDLGSGKGRVVLLASRKPFKAVIGVDFSYELCAIAEGNLARFRPYIAAQEVLFVNQDAALFDFPRGPLIVYCYFAFTREVLVSVLERLSHRQDETIFVYYNVHYLDLFAGSELLHEEQTLRIWRLTAGPTPKGSS